MFYVGFFLKEIDEGRLPNVPAPAIARHCCKSQADATLRDVVKIVQADEAHHRDINHGFASTLSGTPHQVAAAPIPLTPPTFGSRPESPAGALQMPSCCSRAAASASTTAKPAAIHNPPVPIHVKVSAPAKPPAARPSQSSK